MGMFDEITSQIELPIVGKGVYLQTKDFDNALDKYIITEEGRLLKENAHYEVVPEEERPNYGKPEWNMPLGRLAGSIKKVSHGWIDTNFHGILHAYCSREEGFINYRFKFTDGYLESIEYEVEE